MSGDLPAWAGSTDADTLARLLALKGERDWLDYKADCDLSTRRGVVELTKDVGAMMITGGYLVVGATDAGSPAGGITHPELFDPATLHDKLAKYLPKPIGVRSAVHSSQGQSYALIYIAPHPDGFCIFAGDGTYQDGQKQAAIFRAGEVFARHGTKSERWNQHDVAAIKRQLRMSADRGRDQRAEAHALLESAPPQLGGTGIWLGVAVVPEYPAVGPGRRDRDTTQKFLNDWEMSQAPLEALATGTATYRQPGGVVVTNDSAINALPHWWRLDLRDDGQAAGAHVLSHEVVSAGDPQWYGLPGSTYDGQTIPVRRDKIESHLLDLMDLLTAHALAVGAGGRVLIMAALLPKSNRSWSRVAVVREAVDENEERQAWHLASARALRDVSDALFTEAVQTMNLADTRDAATRVCTAYALAGDLLAIFGIDDSTMLRPDGTIDPYGAATDRQQIVYQHARHVGLPVDDVSPIERRKQYEDAVKAARDKLRLR